MITYPAPKFYALPNGTFWARVARNGSTSIEWAIKTVFHPEIPATNPSDRTLPLWRWQIPWTLSPAGNVYMLVRDPVDRFLSACYYYRIPADIVDNVIASLNGSGPFATRWQQTREFLPQSTWVFPGLTYHYYDFANGPQPLANAVGLGVLLQLNKSSQPKIILTDAQTGAVQTYYAADVTLYNANKSAGPITPPPLGSALSDDPGFQI
jgi:hypothetical protein